MYELIKFVLILGWVSALTGSLLLPGNWHWVSRVVSVVMLVALLLFTGPSIAAAVSVVVTGLVIAHRRAKEHRT